MRTYLIIRHGANSANQPMTPRLPVALVEAKNRGEAEATEHDGDARSPAFLKLAPRVKVWANQRVEAVPLSRARVSEVRDMEETMMRESHDDVT